MSQQHTDLQYEHELDRLRDMLVRMAGLVEQMIADAIEALVRRDPALAERTITMDRRVNRAEVDIDQHCMLILAKRQPVASDLRFVTLAMKMVTDLERIGDVAVNICERVPQLEGKAMPPEQPELAQMAVLARGMVRDAIDAFVARDVEKAQEVLARDDEVDELYHRVFRTLLAHMRREPEALEVDVALQSVAKFLERIGDHATNLAEQVVFMVRGTDLRHQGKL